MKNRREFLGGCASAAVLMALPGSGALAGPARFAASDGYALEAFKALEGRRVALAEGGSVRVNGVEVIAADRRCEQFVVQVEPIAALDSGIYHLETATGPRALYLEAGGAGRRTLTAAISRLRV